MRGNSIGNGGNPIRIEWNSIKMGGVRIKCGGDSIGTAKGSIKSAENSIRMGLRCFLLARQGVVGVRGSGQFRERMRCLVGRTVKQMVMKKGDLRFLRSQSIGRR